jgi:hypothetical protein
MTRETAQRWSECSRGNGMTTYQPGNRVSATARTDPGVEGNSRLTSVTGLLLIGLLAVEGLTILSIRGLITWHIFIGIVLIGPVLLKTATTVYRFTRYYTGRPAYVQKGPPHIILRVVGPLVVLTSLIVLGTGLGLLGVHRGQGGLLLLAHKASFILWAGFMTIHVLGHVREAAVASWQEVHPQPGDPAARRRLVRAAAVAASLAIGIGAAAAITPSATAWTSHHIRHDGSAAIEL